MSTTQNSAFESLGRHAAKCEADATKFPVGTWEHQRLNQRAEAYRCAQLELLAGDTEQRSSIDAVIELIYAGKDLANHFPETHPQVVRFFAAVEAVRSAAL